MDIKLFSIFGAPKININELIKLFARVVWWRYAKALQTPNVER